MSDDNEIADENLGIIDSIMELWNRAKPNAALTTSQKIQPIDPEAAEKYRQMKDTGKAVQDIKRLLEKQEQERQKNDPWKFVRNVAKFVVGEIDKSDKR